MRRVFGVRRQRLFRSTASKNGKIFELKYHNGFIDAVGNTPLIRLNGVSEETGCEIFGKAEFLNLVASTSHFRAEAG